MMQFFSYPFFKFDRLNGFMIVAAVVFFILSISYSIKFMQGHPRIRQYYLYLVLSLVSAIGALLANNLIILLVCWGFLGFTLYLLINMGDAAASKAAKKAMIIVGGSDALMILGIGIIYYVTRTFQIDIINLAVDNGMLAFAYVCLAIGCFAKAGAVPFYSWVPDCAKSAPAPVNAFILTCLDKLLAVYLLVRISSSIFIMNSQMSSFLMLIGACSIIFAMVMALAQRDINRLLGFSSISQAGYMILGIGSANPIGITGALFHVINHAVYKSCLFFTSGNVQFRAKTTEFDKLGGLSRLMPLTYICSVIAGLSLSGIPPFNGFVSKWLIYQGLIFNISGAASRMQSIFSVFALIAAMFGSAMTLAAVMKLLHSVFLGARMNAV
ncbi:MAG: NADH-quinone oxidoreductase subunit L, partial [Candidatus Omnitrophica bacterium]|nr:NADH-quinone oxidoreductase subunit L [Candidatus Omnitrophota bacterium]